MNYTTIEQSKKLLELGLNTKSADMAHIIKRNNCKEPWKLAAEKPGNVYTNLKDSVTMCLSDYALPCWSLGALMELMPKIKEDEDDCGCYPTLCKGYNTDKWHCVYRSSIYITNWFDNSIDAAFDMVVWLLENGYIKTEKI
jgi:hypothetical protein